MELGQVFVHVFIYMHYATLSSWTLFKYIYLLNYHAHYRHR